MNTVLYTVKQPGVNYIEEEPDDVCTCMELFYNVIYIIIGKKISRSEYATWHYVKGIVLYVSSNLFHPGIIS
jgi:hypothetical protein